MGEYRPLTLFTHRASPSSRALAAEVIAIVLTGAPVEAWVGAAGLLSVVVRLSPTAAYSDSWRQRACGDSCCGGGSGGQRRGDWR